MSKKLSFEEALRQKMNELPLPDENESWQQMKALLDEKEKRRGFIFFRYEKIVGGVLLLCALLAGFALSLQTGSQSKNMVVRKKTAPSESNKETTYKVATSKNSLEEKGKKAKQAYLDTVSLSSTISDASSVSSLSKNNFLSKQKNITSSKNLHDIKERKEFTSESGKSAANQDKSGYNHKIDLQKQEVEITALNATKQDEQTPVIHDSSHSFFGETDSNSISSVTGIDSNLNTSTNKSNVQKTDSVLSAGATSATAIKVRRRSPFFIDVGIGMKQQIPIDSQAFVAYNYNGKKSWAGDYIPSLYVKLEKEKRWFLQGEFYYAAPRLIKSVSYLQKTKADYGHSNVTADRYYLQKTWYSEVPVSLNIYVRPSLSVGAGVMYNILRGTAAVKETTLYNALTGEYSNESKRMPWKGFTDSFLYKTNTSLLLQTDYQIRQWSFGLRYLHDVQPFLTYTLPDGEKKDKRNASLELLIRYRFYHSGKFRIGQL